MDFFLNPFWKILSGHKVQKRILNFQKSLNFLFSFSFLLSPLFSMLLLSAQPSSSVQFSHSVRLTVTLWTAECRAFLSLCNSQSLLKLMSIQSVMPTNGLILCSPFSCLQSFPASGSFPISSSHQVAKVLEFHLLAVQGTLKNLLQDHRSKASVLQCSDL